MNNMILTRGEQKVWDCLIAKSGMVVTRDNIAQAVWGLNWLSKYSDWQIDHLIYLVRHKLPDGYIITTLRNRGYILEKRGMQIPNIKIKKVLGTIPPDSYLEYMNNPKNVRKVLKDLFTSFEDKISANEALVINSYSIDNIDAANDFFGKKCDIYFSSFDGRALKMHSDRAESMKLTNIHTVYDDIRDSSFKDKFFDCIINDFRLNFNADDKQNVQSVNEMRRILRPQGKILVSVVVDARYESIRFGKNQEKAPTNKDKPWTFMADEGLERKCFTVPYYKRLFNQAGLKLIKEFDTEEGKKWYSKFKHYEETHQPAFRRFLLALK